MAEILDKLLPDTQQRIMKLQYKYNFLTAEYILHFVCYN